MQKNTNKKIKTGLLVFVSLAFGWVLSAGPAAAEQGLSIDVQVKDLETQAEKDEISAALPEVKYSQWHGESVYKTVGNIDYYGATRPNLRTAFPLIARTSSYLYPVKLKAKGSIYIPAPGNYDFDWNYTGNAYVGLEIYDKDGTVKCDSDIYEISCRRSPSFSAAGWYEIYFAYSVYESSAWNTDPQVSLRWDTPASTGFETIPADSFDSSNWDDKVIFIPTDGKDQIDYKVAGVGTDTFATGNAELRVQFPAGIFAENILSDGVQLFWRNRVSTTLRVRNVATSQAIDLPGTRLSTAKGIELQGITAKLPASFFPTSNDNDDYIHLKFENMNADLNGDTWRDFDGGVALVIVYRDLTKPTGRLEIRALSENVYQSASHTISFDVSSMDPITLRPFFLLEDGMSKASPASDARHNYMAMKVGTGTLPDESELFIKGRVMTAADEINIDNSINSGAKRIIPRLNGAPNPAGPVDLWYPEYGREGPEIDVLSTAGNYAPNSLYGGYVSGSSDGVFDPSFSIPPGKDWVSFQYAASDFAGDGSDPLHSNESSFFFATGLLYYDAEKLLVCPASWPLKLGETKSLEARHWDTYFGMPDCNTTGYTDVASSAAWLSTSPSLVSVGAATGSIKGEAATTAPVTISAEYNSITAVMEATVDDTSCVYYSCDTSACVANPGTSPCPANSGGCTSSLDTCTSGNTPNVRWEEVSP